MSVAPIFSRQIKPAAPSSSDIRKRRWIYIPYDRFTDRIGPLTEQPAEQTGIVIVESTAKAHRRPYHKKKLVLLISNMRHFALEQAARGVRVLYHFSPLSHGQALAQLQATRALPALTLMRPAERELRLDLAQAVSRGLKLQEVPYTTWLSQTEDFTSVYGAFAAPRPKGGTRSYVMDRFYRAMRQKTGILMQNAKPLGGQFSFDADNRNPYKGQVPVPTPPTFAPDDVTLEVLSYVGRKYAHHFGSIDNFNLPCTQLDCDIMWSFALDHLLPTFGPYEDAMRDDQPQLFHSRTSAFVNLARHLPLQLVRDVEQATARGLIPLASAEGFIRQLLGWREFMRHLHEQTDGYRLLDVPLQDQTRPQETSPDADESRDPYAASPVPSSVVARTKPRPTDDPYAGATPSALHASLPLPAVYWGVKSGLHCMDTVVAQVVEEGWSHHITRLMVLSNLANLCGFSPRELTDWFWFAYVDAYDWVVEPNVLGMATYADGGLTATKPYVSGAAYINRMSNYCGHCQYDPKKSVGPGSCPFTALYWTFLERNQEILGRNFRMQMPYNTLRKKSAAELVQLRTRAEEAVRHLQSFERPVYQAISPAPPSRSGAK
ncbi:MAG: cryptochrome/photolyase family protein [Acidobacteriaceae bacterium]